MIDFNRINSGSTSRNYLPLSFSSFKKGTSFTENSELSEQFEPIEMSLGTNKNYPFKTQYYQNEYVANKNKAKLPSNEGKT